MNARRLSSAFLIALTISGTCTWLLSHRMKTFAMTRVPDQRYVAMAKGMQPGQALKAEDLELINWPSNVALPGAFGKIDDLVGRSLLYPMDKDQPITDKLLSAPGAGNGLAGRIPNGMRAIALRTDEVMGVAGFLAPGSHLDVLVTYRTEKVPEPTTLTVLQDAEVIAAGQKSQPDPEGKPLTATVVTLLLTPADAQRAVLASTQGSIHFVLRSGSDKGHVREAPLALSQLSGDTPRSPVQAPVTRPLVTFPARPAVEKAPMVVETILGDKHSTETFGGGK